MSERHLFLDFDGVINGLDSRSVSTEWGRVENVRMQQFPIAYAPQLVAAVEAIAADGVTVTWLTTWCEHTVDFMQLGFSAHPYIGAVEHGLPWWKWNALDEHLNGLPTDAVIGWCDDDLAESAYFNPAIQTFIDRPNILGITPHRWTGLTRQQVADLRAHFGIEATQ